MERRPLVLVDNAILAELPAGDILPGSGTVAVNSSGTPGYLYGTGDDGVLRLDSTLHWTKDASNGFVTLGLGVIDGGTF